MSDPSLANARAKLHDPPRHDAKFSAAVVDAIWSVVNDPAVPFAPDGPIVDPFAGVGTRLRDFGRGDVFGIELEPEWVGPWAPWVRQGDALDVSVYPAQMGAIVTSPCYGNRMADQYLGEPCPSCKGTGWEQIPVPSWSEFFDEAPTVNGEDPCDDCDGSGRQSTRRYGYAISLGRKVSEGSAAGLQWGHKYRAFHMQWIRVVSGLMAPGPRRLVLNMSDHYRGGERQYVVDWWVHAAARQGFRLVECSPVDTPRIGHGQNHESRAESEVLAVFDLVK